MIIQPTDRTLVLDISDWEPFIEPSEWIAGGVTDVIAKIGQGFTTYPKTLANCAVIAKTSLRLHAYWWDDPILNPTQQAGLCIDTIKKSGLPFLSAWADQEQWWNDWTAWRDARNGKIEWTEVPVISGKNLSSHYRIFSDVLMAAYPGGGYWSQWFITGYAPQMAQWVAGRPAWVAQYLRQPKAGPLTWDELKTKWLPNYDPVISGTGITAADLWGHQFTGDVCQLPGAYQDKIGGKRAYIDVNVFSASKLASLGGSIPPIQPKPQTWQEAVDAFLRPMGFNGPKP